MFFRLFKEGFLFAVKSVIVNKLRTFLSLFGITIGIFSIISVFTVLDWMQQSIHERKKNTKMSYPLLIMN